MTKYLQFLSFNRVTYKIVLHYQRQRLFEDTALKLKDIRSKAQLLTILKFTRMLFLAVFHRFISIVLFANIQIFFLIDPREDSVAGFAIPHCLSLSTFQMLLTSNNNTPWNSSFMNKSREEILLNKNKWKVQIEETEQYIDADDSNVLLKELNNKHKRITRSVKSSKNDSKDQNDENVKINNDNGDADGPTPLNWDEAVVQGGTIRHSIQSPKQVINIQDILEDSTEANEDNCIILTEQEPLLRMLSIKVYYNCTPLIICFHQRQSLDISTTTESFNQTSLEDVSEAAI